MKVILILLQVIFSILLIGLILMQTSQGGLGSAFGGGESFRTKRGAEKLVFNGTILVAAIFLIISVINLLV